MLETCHCEEHLRPGNLRLPDPPPPAAEGREGFWIASLSLAMARVRSGALTAALVGLGVVVTALLADPVADQVLGALELLRPCIAGHQARGLPHHVELAV